MWWATVANHLVRSWPALLLCNWASMTLRLIMWSTATCVSGNLGQISEIFLHVVAVDGCIICVMIVMASLLGLCIGQCSAIVRLTTRLGSAHLILPTDESAVSQGGFVAPLWLLIEVLWSFSFTHLCHCLVMIIAFKKLLDAWSLQFSDVLKHLFRVGVLPLTVCVLGVEVIFSPGRDKRCRHLLLIKSLPVEAQEPRMFLKNLWAFFSESISWFSLNEPVNEVSGLVWPASWDLIVMNLDLLG